MNLKAIEKSIKDLLIALGEDPERPGLKETPARVARLYQEVLSGHGNNPISHLKVFPNDSLSGLIVVKNIHFFSTCEHHLVPFFGEVSIGYIPNEKLLGLSKFARIVEVFARRLQLQEHLTKQILVALEEVLQPKGCAVRIEAKHLCMMSRGIKSNGSCTITTQFAGMLGSDQNLKAEFLQNFV